MGVVVAQMSRINRIVRPDHARMLRNKACLCQGLAIVILLIGSYRFFREQNAIKGTGTRASQWSLLAAGILTLAVSMVVKFRVSLLIVPATVQFLRDYRRCTSRSLIYEVTDYE